MEAKLHSQKPSLQNLFITPQDRKRYNDIQNWPKERLSNGILETLLDEIAVIDDETGRSEKKI